MLYFDRSLIDPPSPRQIIWQFCSFSPSLIRLHMSVISMLSLFQGFTGGQAECITYTFTQLMNDALREQRKVCVEKAALVRIPVSALFPSPTWWLISSQKLSFDHLNVSVNLKCMHVCQVWWCPLLKKCFFTWFMKLLTLSACHAFTFTLSWWIHELMLKKCYNLVVKVWVTVVLINGQFNCRTCQGNRSWPTLLLSVKTWPYWRRANLPASEMKTTN